MFYQNLLFMASHGPKSARKNLLLTNKFFICIFNVFLKLYKKQSVFWLHSSPLLFWQGSQFDFIVLAYKSEYTVNLNTSGLKKICILLLFSFFFCSFRSRYVFGQGSNLTSQVKGHITKEFGLKSCHFVSFFIVFLCVGVNLLTITFLARESFWPHRFNLWVWTPRA